MFLLLVTNHKSSANLQFLNSSAKRTYKVLLVDLFVKNLESPTIPLVSETSHMLVFQLLAAKIAIPTIPLVSETTAF